MEQSFLLDEKGKHGHHGDREKQENRLLAQSIYYFLIYFTVFFPSFYTKRKSHLYMCNKFFFSNRDLDVRKMASFVAMISDFNLNAKEDISERL